MSRRIGLLVFVSYSFCAQGQVVTQLEATYRYGQVFITFQHNGTSGTYFLLYRSEQPITAPSQLAACEYLGMVNHESSKNHTLSSVDGMTRYFVTADLATPLTASKGLMVTTCVANKAYYYAVTRLSGGSEDLTIVPGSNALTSPVNETVATPRPVLQEKRTMSQQTIIDIYVQFLSSRVTPNGPLRFKAVSLGFCFAVNPGQLATKPAPLYVNFHGGGGNFMSNITSGGKKKILLNVSHHLPSGDVTAWLGSNQNYDVWIPTNNTVPPTSGFNFFYTQTAILEAIRFVVATYQADSNRVHLIGNSNGSNGAFMLALVYPEKIASCEVTGGMYNFGFLNDYNPDCSMNSGKYNRVDGDNRFGTVAANLTEGVHMKGTYDLINGPVQVHLRRETDFPVFKGLNGKNDKLMGWTEKVIWYDSVNRNRIGGYFYFDMRQHGGEGRSWNALPFEPERYATNISYPAFSYCSANENPGVGNNVSGDSVGSVNGYLNWADPDADQPDLWKIRLFMRNLATLNGVKVAPDSCTVDVTPRRRQQFKPAPGTPLLWEVRRYGQLVQSGFLVYEGGLLTIPAVKVFKDTSTLSISIATGMLKTYYQDADGDGFGNAAIWQQAFSAPSGYVENDQDCNDGNSAVYPGATESCNGMDDDCDGVVDEQTFTASITPANSFSQCEGTKVTFTANESGMSYQWFRNEVAISGATKKKYDSKGSEAGTYKVRETNSSGCTAFSNEVTLTRVEKPKASIKAEGSLNICSTGSVTLKAKNGTGTQWQWYKNDVAIAGATQKTYVATSVGQYKVKVTEPVLGCNKTSKPVTVTSSCRQLENVPFDVRVGPNPANTVLQVYIRSDVEECSGLMELHTVSGQRVRQQALPIHGCTAALDLPVHDLPAGLYWLQIRLIGFSRVIPVEIVR
ncbi:MAG: MopE-related protein [Chitinophagales bacterium]|nr:MopE-related protein [Chitinophagales bacterium]